MSIQEDQGHGEVTKLPLPFIQFTEILKPRNSPYPKAALAALAEGMITPRDALSDGPDPEENLYMPAGYTYVGQFIDHDLTLDTTSTLNPDDVKDPNKDPADPTNLRSPRFDLDCVYGNGPADQPYMYFGGEDDAVKGYYRNATLVIGEHDLARACNGPKGAPNRAIIGDKRNDENSIVNQIQQAFINFHNKVVVQIAASTAKRGSGLFAAARQEVRWTYQQIILGDFLPRIVDALTLSDFAGDPKPYQLYPAGPLRRNLPREFVAAAYRFGHSAVRTGYRLNGKIGPTNGTILPIFVNPPDPKVDNNLVGFDPLPGSHVIDNWGRFFPADFPPAGQRPISNAGVGVDIKEDGSGGDGTVRLQYAYKLDPGITDPLANLPPKISPISDLPADVQPEQQPGKPAFGPSLALLNLLRGNVYGLHGGQEYAKKMGLTPLEEKYLCVRRTIDAANGKEYTFEPISELTFKHGGAPEVKIGDSFKDDTPLWFYILAEAQRPLVDFWLEHGGPGTTLTEAHLKGLNEGKPMPSITGDPNDPAAAKNNAAIAKQQLADTRCAGTQLGGVGGRIVAEVFYGLMESDADSVLKAPKNWAGPLGPNPTMAKLLRFVDPATAPN